MFRTVLIFFALSFFVVFAFFIGLFNYFNNTSPSPSPIVEVKKEKVSLITPPSSKILPTNYHIFQRFNNCGPAALSMDLRFYGVIVSQEKLGQDLRPYQVASGNNDDKSVNLRELSHKAQEYGFVTYHRPGGDADMIKHFISYDMPIITRTWTKPNEDIGHYRVVKGYDDERGAIIQDDSLQNKNLWYTYRDFDDIWNKFNNEFLVLVPKEKVKIAETILGDLADEKVAWEKSAARSREILANNPKDVQAGLNLSVSLFNIGDYEGSIREFERVESRLPYRALWYQTEPIEAYYVLGMYERVFALTDKILKNQNIAYSELYVIRGEIYQQQGRMDLAKIEFEKAVLYNKNSKEAQRALASIS